VGSRPAVRRTEEKRFRQKSAWQRGKEANDGELSLYLKTPLGRDLKKLEIKNQALSEPPLWGILKKEASEELSLMRDITYKRVRGEPHQPHFEGWFEIRKKANSPLSCGAKIYFHPESKSRKSKAREARSGEKKKSARAAGWHRSNPEGGGKGEKRGISSKKVL